MTTAAIVPEVVRRQIYVFALSAMMLTAQFLFVRILGFTHWFHFIYFTMSVALLGYAIGGCLLSRSRVLRSTQFGCLVPWCFLGFGLSAWVAMSASVTVAPNTVQIIGEMRQGNMLPALLMYVPLTGLMIVPFVFASLLTGKALMAGEYGKVYGSDLLGTAVGAAVFLGCIHVLGAWRLLYSLIVVAAVCAWIGAASSSMKWARVVAGALVLFGGIGAAVPDSLIVALVDPSKNIGDRYPEDILFTEWTPMFRVDASREAYGARFYIDGDAQTWVYRIPSQALDSVEPFIPDPGQVSRHTVFRLVPKAARQTAVVIGSGGGMDVVAAHQAGFQRIFAIDVDPVRQRRLLHDDQFASMIQYLYRRPHVHPVVDDGRSFIRYGAEPVDAIMLYNVDSLAGVSTGAYNLVENYLYTAEAFDEYLARLGPRGILQVTRPTWGGEIELSKLFLTSMAAITRLGVPRPARHLLVLQNHDQVDFLLSKNEFTTRDIEVVSSLYAQGGRGFAILYSNLEDGERAIALLGTLSAAVQGNGIEELYASSKGNIYPNTDDHPFFFENGKWNSWKDIVLNLSNTQFQNWGRFLLSVAFVVCSASSVIMIIVALSGSGRRYHSQAPRWFVAGFFVSIGMGYMFLQITLIQKLSLTIGHPIKSMATIIPTLLLCMGVASLMVNRRLRTLSSGERMAVAVLGVVPIVLIGVEEQLLMPLLQSMRQASEWVRIGATALTLAPLGLGLGIMMPMGLRVLCGDDDRSTSLAWTFNGCASVVGSLLALVLSLAAGFSATIAMAAGWYVVATTFLWLEMARRHVVEQRLQREFVSQLPG